MYKVVIIDDEPIIVEGLKKTVNWGNFQCVVAGVAFSGEEGITLIRNEKPDIIFTDIQMPRLDGLTMIAAIKSEFPNAQVAILTGYRDFDYAQKAIRLGVARFLLKPSKMDELMEALGVMTKKLAELESDILEESKDNLLSSKEKEAARFIEGQTFAAEGEKGWYLITVDGYSLGWGKLAGGIMKNHYPKGLRKNIF